MPGIEPGTLELHQDYVPLGNFYYAEANERDHYRTLALSSVQSQASEYFDFHSSTRLGVLSHECFFS